MSKKNKYRLTTTRPFTNYLFNFHFEQCFPLGVKNIKRKSHRHYCIRKDFDVLQFCFYCPLIGTTIQALNVKREVSKSCDFLPSAKFVVMRKLCFSHWHGLELHHPVNREDNLLQYIILYLYTVQWTPYWTWNMMYIRDEMLSHLVSIHIPVQFFHL